MLGLAQQQQRFRFLAQSPIRQFSSQVNDNENDEDGIDFPYLFLNTDDTLVKPAPETNKHLHDQMVSLLTMTQTKEYHGIDQPNLKNLISLAYIDLLEAIARGDRSHINSVCEANLYQAFSEGLDELNLSTKDIKVMNNLDDDEYIDAFMDGPISKLFDVEIVD